MPSTTFTLAALACGHGASPPDHSETSSRPSASTSPSGRLKRFMTPGPTSHPGSSPVKAKHWATTRDSSSGLGPAHTRAATEYENSSVTSSLRMKTFVSSRWISGAPPGTRRSISNPSSQLSRMYGY